MCVVGRIRKGVLDHADDGFLVGESVCVVVCMLLVESRPWICQILSMK